MPRLHNAAVPAFKAVAIGVCVFAPVLLGQWLEGMRW